MERHLANLGGPETSLTPMKTDAIVGIKVTETFSKASGRLGKRFFTFGTR